MSHKAVLFGSIGTLIETSEIQRNAFNEAFRRSGLDWYWNREFYRDQLALSGGQNRVRVYAATRGISVDVEAIHHLKTDIFNTMLLQSAAVPRPGVLKMIHHAKSNGHSLGFVTTTSRDNVEAILACMDPYIAPDTFDFVGSVDQVKKPKPDPEIYNRAMASFGLSAYDCVAIEDSEPSLAAALAARIPTIAFPGANSIGQNFTGAMVTTSVLNPDQVGRILEMA